MPQNFVSVERLVATWRFEGHAGRAATSFKQVSGRQNCTAVEEQCSGTVIAAVADANDAIVAFARIGTVARVGVVRGRSNHVRDNSGRAGTIISIGRWAVDVKVHSRPDVEYLGFESARIKEGY